MIRLARRGLLAAALALAAGAASARPTPSTADPNRLFADSRLVVRERFSDEVVGRGPDLVFIPGLASSRQTWKATAERLRGRYRLHLIQVAGFAGEPARGNATGEVLAPTAEALDGYLVEQKLTPATLIGHSLGGTMTLYLAQKHPEHLRRALVVDALPFFGALFGGPEATPQSLEPMAAKIRAPFLAADAKADRAALDQQNATMAADPEARGRVTDWGIRSDRTVVGRMLYEDMLLDLRPGLPTMKTPVVLAYPDYSPLGAPAAMTQQRYEGFYQAAPSVTLRRVDHSLHFIMFDQPQAFADLLDGFLAGR